jgi:hypothetical protein
MKHQILSWYQLQENKQLFMAQQQSTSLLEVQTILTSHFLLMFTFMMTLNMISFSVETLQDPMQKSLKLRIISTSLMKPTLQTQKTFGTEQKTSLVMYPLYHHHVRHMKYTQSKQFYCLHWLCLLFHAKLTDYSPYLQILNQTLKSSSKLPTSHNLDSRPSIQHSTHVKTLTLFSFQFSTTPIMNIYWNQNCPWQTSSYGMKTPLSTPSMLLQWHIQFCMEQTMFTCQKPTKSTKMKISPKKRNLKASMNFWKQVHIPCLCLLCRI